MDNKFKRFKNNELNISELEMLRNDVANMTDEELSAQLDESDCSEEFSVMEIEEIQRKLNMEIRRSRCSLRYRWIQYGAAAFILGILVAGGIFIYSLQHKNRMYEEILSNQIHLATQYGENIVTILPDGSRVEVGPMSVMDYKLSSFNNSTREVLFYGEGRFDILKNEKAPFTVHMQDLDIQVLGTVFSVLSREDKDIVEVHLEEGAVNLIGRLGKQTVLHPGETAVLDKKTGDLKIYAENDGYRHSAGEPVVYFKSDTLNEVFTVLRTYYGKEFSLSDNLSKKYFTGSLPTDDLPQALYILQLTLNLKITFEGDRYVIKE